ncbi:uncharacterized protein LOC110847713 [Folsomia candida]|uniref:Cytosolic phospholipase A2 zeta n=1 Tax=Folsomia candida TaxID=158441 RepID=A0A226EM55_FOLCA|nr:uncharacterized protein LOC110847713 [Folsomia candida]OXA58712.1 Cytosolic phospholipase A2 zeta [Folsomia candida]
MHGKLFMCLLLGVTLLDKRAESQGDQTEVIISLFATDLNGCDALSACDAFVKILCSTASYDWRNCGQTREMTDDNFPVWPERFTFQYTQSERMRWRFDVIDKDVLFDDPIGSVSVVVEEFLNATEVQSTVRYDLNGRGSFFVHRRRL